MSCSDPQTFREILKEIATDVLETVSRDGRAQTLEVESRMAQIEARQDRQEKAIVELRQAAHRWRRQWELLVSNGE